MKPFLECYVFSLFPENNAPDFYFIESCYKYNSLENTSYKIPSNIQFSIQVPDFLIENKNLLDTIDFDFLHQNDIEVPVIRNLEDSWKVDLTYYEKVYTNV